jgi:hypothetical protein
MYVKIEEDITNLYREGQTMREKIYAAIDAMPDEKLTSFLEWLVSQSISQQQEASPRPAARPRSS